MLDRETFELVENLAPVLRSRDEPSVGSFFGYVDELRGDTKPAGTGPSGEVRLTLFNKEEELRARAELTVDEYLVAVQAHISNTPIAMQGTLHRLPRLNKIEQVKSFQLLELDLGTIATDE